MNRLGAQITPFAGSSSLPPELASLPESALAKIPKGDLDALMLPPDHPLPKVLAQAKEALADAPDASFEDLHKLKRAVDDAVNWDSPAKKQVQQISKAFRTKLRSTMTAAGHAPYEQATADYAQIAQLYDAAKAGKIADAAGVDPEKLVRSIQWTKPTQAQLLKDLLVETPKQGSAAGAGQGEAAWNALRAAWTHERLATKGPAAMLGTMRKMEASASGQEFIQTMYGDPAGQAVWGRLKQLGEAFESVLGSREAFEASSLARPQTPASVTRDIVYGVGLHGNPITKMGAISRLGLSGPKIGDLLQWAAYTPQRTQMLIHGLTGPEPGMFLTDFWRLAFPGRSGKPEAPPTPTTPAPTTTAAPTPPPEPRMLR